MPRKSHFLLALAAAVLLAAALGLPVFGQDPPLFIDRVDIEVVNVEVFVTDRDGNHVSGLTLGDFELFEDGERIEITNFYTVLRDDRALADADLTLEELRRAPPPAPDAERPLLPEDQQLNLLVYVDNFNLHPHERSRVLEELDGFLEDRLIQGDRVMLVGYGGSLEILFPFTRDRARVREGLERLGKAATHRPINDAERRRTLRLMRDTLSYPTGTSPLDAAYQMLRAYVQQEQTELRATARSLLQVVRAQAGLPGRKALIYISSGLSKRPGEDLYAYLEQLFGDAQLQGASAAGEFIDPSMEALVEDASDLFDLIVREANAQQVTLYPVDARGSGGSSMSAEFDDLGVGGAGRVVLDQVRSTGLQEPLLEMAQGTGGRAIVNTLNFDDAFARVGGDFDNFYSLGYRPRQGRDGELHKIEVKVANPELRVRHRETYDNKPELERIGDRTLSSLVLDMASNPLGAQIAFGPPEQTSGRKWEVPLLVRVPIDKVTILPNGDVHEGRLHFFLAVQDQEGLSKLHHETYPISIPADRLADAAGREIGYTARIKVRKGVPKIAIGIFDELSGIQSFLQQSVLVGVDPDDDDPPGKTKARKARKTNDR